MILGQAATAALAAKNLDSKRAVYCLCVMAITVPCMAQTALIAGLVGR